MVEILDIVFIQMKEKKDMAQGKFDYSWVVVALGFLMVFVTLGFCSSNKGFYLDAVKGDTRGNLYCNLYTLHHRVFQR